jgi:hypothetical protein
MGSDIIANQQGRTEEEIDQNALLIFPGKKR